MFEEMKEYLQGRAALRRAWAQARQIAVSLTEPCGLTPARYEVLHALESPDEHIDSQSGLQKRLGVKASTMSRLIGDLVKHGLVVRHRDDDDRRLVRLATTDEGRARYAKAKERFDSADVGAACGLILAAMSDLPMGGSRRGASATRPIAHRPLFGGGETPSAPS